MDIPIELFGFFLGVSMVLVGIGLTKRQGVAMFAGGLFIIFIAVLTDNIIMGKIPESSTVSGSVTTYVMVDNPFSFTEWHKILMALIGVVIMVIGAFTRAEN